MMKQIWSNKRRISTACPRYCNPPVRNNATKSGAQSKSIEISQILPTKFFPSTRNEIPFISNRAWYSPPTRQHVNAKLTRLIAATWISFRGAKREENRALIEFQFGADNGVDTRDKTPPTLPLRERTNEPEEGRRNWRENIIGKQETSYPFTDWEDKSRW